jgi:uncharacterized protein
MKKHPPTARSRTAMSCSTCGRRFFLDETPTPPFCSERCQLIDLGRWLDESIGVPFEGDAEDTPVEYRDEEPKSLSPRNHRDIDYDDET